MAKKRTFGFDAAKDAIRQLKERGVELADEVRTDLLIEEAAYVRSAIENQELDLEPLNVDYLVHKILSGLDPRVLIATHEYVNTIDVYMDPSGDKYVGVPDVKHIPAKRGGPAVNMQDLSKWLEFGTITMPARPHFGPVHRRVMIRLPLRLAKVGFRVVKGRQRRGQTAR